MEPEYQSFWQRRASDARTRAEKTRDPRTREDLFAIAETCERLAELLSPKFLRVTTKIEGEIENA